MRIVPKTLLTVALGALALMGQLVVNANLASAALLGLTQQAPDISSQPVSVNFDSNTGIFQVQGSVLSGFDLDGSQPPDYDSSDFGGAVSYAISLSLSNTGVLNSGSLQINGTLPAVGANSGILLTSTANAFGFQDVGPFSPVSLFEMLFTATGGDLHTLGYFPSNVGVILSAFVDPNAPAYDALFTHSFAFSSELSQTDTFAQPVPEPTSAVLVLVGLPFLAFLRRKTRSFG